MKQLTTFLFFCASLLDSHRGGKKKQEFTVVFYNCLHCLSLTVFVFTLKVKCLKCFPLFFTSVSFYLP